MNFKNLCNTLIVRNEGTLKKLYDIQTFLNNKVYFLLIKVTLNNIYLIISNSFGKVIILNSGGILKLNNFKKNTNYILELLLLDIIKKLKKFSISSLILKIDILSLKKKKVLLKILQKFKVKVLYIQILPLKAFNGVRFKKKRRI